MVDAATSANTASAIVKRDASGNFNAGIITADLVGNSATTTKWLNDYSGNDNSLITRVKFYNSFATIKLNTTII